MDFRVNDEGELPEVCRQILDSTSKKVILFNGDLGAGKTTLIKSLCKEIGSKDLISSPTFSLINHYKTKEDQNIFHFDFYRIKSPVEAMDIGFEEYLESGDYCLIEWPEIFMKLIFTEYVTVDIKVEGNSRLIKVH